MFMLLSPLDIKSNYIFFIIINKIMKHSNDTGHSLTVCTKTCMVFTLMCMVLQPAVKNKNTKFHIFGYSGYI